MDKQSMYNGIRDFLFLIFMVFYPFTVAEAITTFEGDSHDTASIISIEQHAFPNQDLNDLYEYISAFSGLRIVQPPSSIETYDLTDNQRQRLFVIEYSYSINQLVFLLERVCVDLDIRCNIQFNDSAIMMVFIGNNNGKKLQFGVW